LNVVLASMLEGRREVLPEPSDLAKRHSERLSELIADRCRQSPDGFLSFAEYMTSALYEPGFGYYMAGSTKFGKEGDFITGPELTPLFGATLGNQVREILHSTGGGILELGAGGGKLASGLLNAVEDQLIDYSILEPSADLVQRQKVWLQESLSAEQFARVRWITVLPEKFTGVIIANEVMDALPVERFTISESIDQLCVSDALTQTRREAPPALAQAVRHIESDLNNTFVAEYCSEVCLLLGPWIASLADSLQRGVILLADYGYPRQEYYAPERSSGTLSCYYRHRAHDNPYLLPGLQDLTAHVDFTAVVESSVTCGLDLLGYTSQSAFLLDNGLLGLMEQELRATESESERIELSRLVKTLILPGEMGERFQVMLIDFRSHGPSPCSHSLRN